MDDASLDAAIEELRRLVDDTPRESSISISDGRRLSLARQILVEDSANVDALTELGVHHAANYHWYANFIAAKQPIGGGLTGSMTREFQTAYEYLDRALLYDPESVDTYRELLRLLIQEDALEAASDVARRLTNRRSDLAEGWALRGLIAQLDDRSDLADYFFDRAIARMDPADRDRFASTELFLTDEAESNRAARPVAFDEAFWFERDPLYLTEENERAADHYARRVFTDLWYGSASGDGWETERGQIIMRYGFPAADFTFTGAVSRFNVLDFGDFEFVFEDQTRGGHFTLYSPKAGAGSGWTSDYVIQASEMEIAMPDRFRFGKAPPVPVKTSVARFRGRDGETDLYIQYAMPVKHAGRPGLDTDPRSEVGGFVTRPLGRIHETDRAAGSRSATFIGLRPFVTGVFRFSLEPGRYATSVEFLNHDRSAFGTARDSLSVENWGQDLALSDVIVASEIEPASEALSVVPGSIARSGYSISPNPWSPIPTGSDALIYFEVYNLVTETDGGASYRVEVEVEPVDSKGLFGSVLSIFGGGDDRGVRTSFPASATGPNDQRWFALDMASQHAGEYALTVVVVDATSGASDRRSTMVSVSN